MLEATQASGFEVLSLDLSQLLLWAMTYTLRPVEDGHSCMVSNLGTQVISQGSQPLG